MGEQIALTGGTKLTVTKRNRDTEAVTVLALAIEDMIPLLEATDHELKQIALYTGKDEAWAKTLTRESQVEVIEKGEEANSDFFGKWMARRTKRMDRLTNALPQKLKLLPGGGETALPSNSSPPKQRSPAD